MPLAQSTAPGRLLSPSGFVLCWLVSVTVSWTPLRQLISLSLGEREYSHLLVVPAISLWLVYWEREKIFAAPAPHPRMGLPLVILCLIGSWLSQAVLQPLSPYTLSITVVCTILTWGCGFFLCYGTASLKGAQFAFLFLLLMAPLPMPVMERLIGALQSSSAELVYRVFNILGVPMFRQGVTFELPGVAIKIAEECSSIHSFWALAIINLLIGHFLLRSFPGKLCLFLLAPPIAVLTNTIRIVTIYFLAIKVDMGFLYGRLHHDGGVLFSWVSLAVLLSFVAIFRRLERRHASRPIPVCEPLAPGEDCATASIGRSVDLPGVAEEDQGGVAFGRRE